MPEFRRYPKGSSRQIIDLMQVLDVMGDEVMICLDVGLLAIIRKLLVERGLWRTTYAISNTDFGYNIPSEAEFNPVRQLIVAFLEDTQNMSTCGQDIKAGLEAIAQAILNKQCCPGAGIGGTGTGGSGGTSGPGSETNTGTPGGHTGDPPTGFDTWGEYDDYKCAVATYIVQEWKNDLDRLVTVIFSSALSTEAIAALVGLSILSPIPGDEILVIVGLTVSAITLGIVSAVYQAAQDVVTVKFDDLICALYVGEDLATVQADARAVIVDGISSEGYSGFTAAFVEQVATSYLNPDNLNRLFDKDTSRTYPAGDCANCDTGVCVPDLPVITGSIVSVTDNQDGTFTYVLASDVDPAYTFRQAIDFGWTVGGGPEEGCGFSWVQGSESHNPSPNGWGGWWWYCDTNVLTRSALNDNTGAGPWRRAKQWGGDATPFQYTVTLADNPCQ